MTFSEPAESAKGGQPPVIDYEGSQYETDFWVGRGRDYEDAAERLALRQLIPMKGKRIAEIGAGFGRLVELYQGYEQIILLDYSRSQLQTAAQRLGHDPRYVFVAGNIYNLPLAAGVLDTLVMVRVMHHLADVPKALQQLHSVLHRESIAVLEFANKRNLKALLRWWSGKQTWSPFTPEPVEFVALNYDFHPTWMEQQFCAANFTVQQRLAVSHLRLGLLKRLVPAASLAWLDSQLFTLGAGYAVSPSVFMRAGVANGQQRNVASTQPNDIAKLFRCTACGTQELCRVREDQLQCLQCAVTYHRKLNVWDFKDASHSEERVIE
jgi:SAM-dependent methyltransferase